MEPRPRCQVCNREVLTTGPIGRKDACEGCGADLHACRQCAFHDPQASNQCREPEADKIADKDRGNFCDFFRLSRGEGGTQVGDPAAEAKRRLEALFRK